MSRSAQGLVTRKWNREKGDLSADLKEASLEKIIREGAPFFLLHPTRFCIYVSKVSEEDRPALSLASFQGDVTEMRCGAHGVPDQKRLFTVHPSACPVRRRRKSQSHWLW